jgi:Domain of unknown function (DUF397)
MNSPDLTCIAWRKSSYSGANGSCVEVAPVSGDVLGAAAGAAAASAGRIAVRDTKDRSGPALVFSARQWRAFTAGIKNDEL